MIPRDERMQGTVLVPLRTRAGGQPLVVRHAIGRDCEAPNFERSLMGPVVRLPRADARLC